MDNLLKDLSSLSKYPNDSKIQLKRISILKDILETLKKLEKKKITENQSKIEDSLYEVIVSSKVTNDLIARYIYYIYKYLNEHGLASHINDFITKYSTLLHGKASPIIKNTSLWLLSKVCTRTEQKTPTMTELIKTLLKVIKSTSNVEMKFSCFGVISRLLNLKLPFFHTQIPDILKMLLKQEKYLTNRKNTIKTLNSIIFYLNPQMIEKNYSIIMEIISKCFDDDNEKIRELAIKTFISLHTDKVFDNKIEKKKVIRKKEGEKLQNFLEVLLYIGTIFNYSKTDVGKKIKMCYLEIMQQLFLLNKDYLNSSESLVTKVFDLMLNEFPIVIHIKEGLNIVNVRGNQNDNESFDFTLNNTIENLYRCFIKVIYNLVYRKTLLMHIFKKLEESQFHLESFENSSLNFNIKTQEQNESKKAQKYTEFEVNAILISLLEFSENNSDIFEQTYKSFQEVSSCISVYVTSSIRTFRLLISRVLSNLSYFLPAWRISILALLLNTSTVAHADVVAFKNTMLYFIEENKPEYKYSLIIKKNIELLKDICNCLALILTMFSHKSHGLPVDTSLNALSKAKKIILGNSIDEKDNPQYKSLQDITNNFSKYDLNAYKESGWIIIQGLCSMDQTWLISNSKTFFFLWTYIFSEASCNIDEFELRRDEYKDTLSTEFFIKKAALASLRKFILSCGEEFLQSEIFYDFMQKIISNILNFFIPYKKRTVIDFYNTHLLSSYQEAKMFLYDCFYAIPTDVYSKKFNSLLYPLSDEIISNCYTDRNYEHIYSCLNQLDNFMCNQNLSLDKYIKYPVFVVDNFVVEKYNFKLTNLLSKSFQFVFSAIKLFVEIILSKKINVQNRINIFKHFLANIAQVAIKKITKNDIGNYNKIVNIAITTYLIIKESCQRGLVIINDESMFTNSKMIFDFCFKSDDDSLLLLIGAEGHSYLIKASNKTSTDLQYYLDAGEIAFRNDNNLSNRDYITTFYMISNIFRNVDFKDISPYLDKYMNFIISNFNKIEDIVSNPFVPQSIFIIMDTLIKNDQVDYVRKLIEIYKVNFLFMNMSNSQFFKELFETNSLAEIRLLIVFAELNDNLKSNELDLFKMFLTKYLRDELYRTQKIQKNFLYFTKVLLKTRPKLRDLVFNENFISFLFEKKENFYEQKLSFEIIITLLLGETKLDSKTLNIKSKIEMLVNYINNLYNKNRNFYFNHQIFTNHFRHINSSDSIYDKNKTDENIQAIVSLIDFNNFSHLNFDVLYKDFHLIKLAKFIIRIYIEKNYLNVLLLLNMIKELVQNQLMLYSSELVKQKEIKGDSLKSDEDNPYAKKTMTLITIRQLNYYMHLNLKKFLIKIIHNSLIESLEKVLVNNKTSLVEVLNYFMGSSMVLVSCEESWGIKILGIELLSQIIRKFATVIDIRAEDNSLLIQQYEAQISSCIKIIFNNTVSIKSVYKGLKLIYMFITVPISTDTNYIKKVSHMVDLNNLKKNEFSITSGGGDITSFSELADHILICKKLIFFCKLYISLKSTNNSSFNCYDILSSRVSQIEIYAKYITPPYRKSIEDFFNENFDKMLNVIIKMISDFYIVLTSDQKTARGYEKYNFMSNGNSIAFSEAKLIKYGQVYFKVLAMMLNDKTSKGYKISKKDSGMVINLILYYVNHYVIKSDVITREEMSEQYKIEHSLNGIMMIELIDSFIKILNNENNCIELDSKEFTNLIKVSIQLIEFGIIELDLQCLVLLNCLFKKYLNNIKSSISKEDMLFFISTVSKILYYYENKTTLTKGKENMIFIELNGNVLELLTQFYEGDNEEEMNEYFYHNMNMLLNAFRDYSGNISKICAGKLFNSMIVIHNEKILSYYIIEIAQCLSSVIKQFDKFFVLFYMILQFISKCKDLKLVTIAQNELIQKLFIKNFEDRNYILILLKSLYLGITQNFDANIKQLIDKLIITFIEERYLLNFFSDDLQNIILTHVFNCQEIEKRRELILIITIAINDNIDVIGKNVFCVFVMKLFNKDIEFIQSEEIQQIFFEDIRTQIKTMIDMQMKYLQEQQEKKNQLEQKNKEEEERKRKEEIKSQETSISITQESSGTKSSGPKLKALKFKK